ncbi:MAG: hypothetical protein IPK82_26750 [Polyangiaceae bacterium]|nr:hypothetical protein [Polyangiaceae bacterium]
MSLARSIRRLFAAGFVAVASFAGMGDMAAQSKPPNDFGESVLTQPEREALDLAREDKLLTARTQAEEILKNNPNSIVGHFVMGTALRDAEGSLPRAMAHLKKARELFEAQYGADGDGGPWRVYADTLFSIAITAGLMEDFEAELRAMDDYDKRFSPKMLAQRVWPLMKLGRYDEARKWAKAAIDTGSSFQKLRALNGLCAVEAEELKRVTNYEACLTTYKYAKAFAENGPPGAKPRSIDITVYANNAHLGALAVLKYDEAEQLAIDGTKTTAETSSNPWLRLARMYIDQGRASEAVTAAKAVQAWRARTPPSTREQFSSEDEGTIAILLLTAGEFRASLRLADRIMNRPDRRAMTSTSPEHTRGGNALLRHAVLKLGVELASERASYSSVLDAPGHLAQSAKYSALAWPDAQRVAGVLLDDQTLVNTLRVYLENGIDYVPTWMLGDLVQVIGPGVFLAGLASARQAEVEVPGYAAFYDALEAEARLAQGDEARALELARKALETLPKAEVLLKSRTAVIGALAAQSLGDTSAALGLFERAMLADPGMVRRLGASLPATFEVGGGTVAQDTADRLRKSPRLSESPNGFVVSVTADAVEVQACLRTPLGAELGCARVPIQVKPPPPQTPPASAAPADLKAERPSPPAPPKEPAERAAEAFHKALFSLKMNLSESDLRSLDGGPTATREAARERMRDLLGDKPDSDEP